MKAEEGEHFVGVGADGVGGWVRELGGDALVWLGN